MSAIQTRANKFPARYFVLIDKTYRDAWEEDEQTRQKMVVATSRIAKRVGAVNYRFIRTPQGGYAPGIFVFSLPPNSQVWKPTGEPDCYVPREDTNSGRRIFNLLAEIPSCSFMKVLSVAGIDNLANIALPPNQVMEMAGKLYLVWYAPAEIPVPFSGATEMTMHEFEQVYFTHLARFRK